MTTTENLWPDFSFDIEMRGPKTILTEQASFLAEGTKNLLFADIKMMPFSNEAINYSFVIVAPNLNGYKYDLFSIYQPQIFFYPCTLKFNNIKYEVDSEKSLLELLKGIFSDKQTQKIINSLIAQSKDSSI